MKEKNTWYPNIKESSDEMFGDQLLGHPCLKEIEALVAKEKIEALMTRERRIFSIEVGKKTPQEIKAILERI